jgi:hypothetical protein
MVVRSYVGGGSSQEMTAWRFFEHFSRSHSLIFWFSWVSPKNVLFMSGGGNMLKIIAVLVISFGSAFAMASSIQCPVMPPGATQSHRDSLPGGGYGFCIIDQCGTGVGGVQLQLMSNQCLLPPSISWVTANQAAYGAPLTITAYAKLSRTPSSPVVVQLSTANSTATSSDFRIVSPTVTFNSALSEPILIEIFKQSQYQAPKDIIIGFSSVVSGSATITPAVLDISLVSTLPQAISNALSLPNVTITEGDSATFTLTSLRPLSNAFPTQVAIVISGPAGNISVPSFKVLMPANRTSVSFTIPTNIISGNQGTRTMHLTASAIGATATPVTGSLVINDNSPNTVRVEVGAQIQTVNGYTIKTSPSTNHLIQSNGYNVSGSIVPIAPSGD